MQIDKTFVIHHGSQLDRVNDFTVWLEFAGWPAFVPTPETRWGATANDRSVGMAQAHRDALNEFATRESEADNWCLILESDARWGRAWLRRWVTIRESVPDDAEVVFFGGSHGVNSKATFNDGACIVPADEIYRTHAYAVRRSATNKVGEVVTRGGYCDVALSRAIQGGELRAYAVNPFVFAQQPDREKDEWYAWNRAEGVARGFDVLRIYATYSLGHVPRTGDPPTHTFFGPAASVDRVAAFISANPSFTTLALIDGEIAVVSADERYKTTVPGWLKQASNFAESLAAHIANGAKLVTPEQHAARMKACHTCPHFNEGRCGLCGCPVEKKARWKSSTCPDIEHKPSRWELL